MRVEFSKWVEAYNKFRESGSDLLWPSETLVRLFKGTYIPTLDKDFTGKSVLDIGFGNGNNLIFLSSLGLECHGIEVSPKICEAVTEKMKMLGVNADLRCGTNTEIPYPDGSFDFLISWNVVHYENCEKDIHRALLEYRRVLKQDGRFFISTTGPRHKILKNAEILGEHRFRIGRDDDFRKGQIYYYFETEENIKSVFSNYFRDILIGRTNDFLMTERLDWFLVTGLKNEENNSAGNNV